MAVNRVGGLASGLDVDQIVSDLMKAERLKLEKLQQQKQILEWQKEDFLSLSSQLRTLRDKAFDLKLQAAFQVRKVVSSYESAVTATATGMAVDGVYRVKVIQLASAASITGEPLANPYQSGLSLKDHLGLAVDGEQTLFLTGPDSSGNTVTKEIKVNVNTDSIYTLVSKINSQTGSDGKTWQIRAMYDQATNRLYLTTTSTGSSMKITVANTVLAQGLKLVSGSTDATATGEDAILYLNNDSVQITSASNTVQIAGLNVQLRATTTDYVTLTVSRDTEAIFNSVKSFIETYNSVLEKLNSEYYEPRYKDYQPLTDSLRENLTDEQENKWEEKARSGMLRFDPLLGSIISKLRTAAMSTIAGISSQGYSSLSSIGINTAAYQEKGKLYLDETKLRQAIESNPDAVMELFVGSSADNPGVAAKLYEESKRALDALKLKAGSSDTLVDNSELGKQLRLMDERIKRMEEQLQRVEDRYWKQFTTLEKAIARMNQQSAWLLSAFGGGSTNR